MTAPFLVRKAGEGWILYPRGWNFAICGFLTPAAACDHARQLAPIHPIGAKHQS